MLIEQPCSQQEIFQHTLLCVSHTVSMLQIMRQRPTLRVVIASATMDIQKFSIFFANAQHLPPSPPRYATGGPVLGEPGSAGLRRMPSRIPAVLSVEGRLYPVQEHFLSVRAAPYFCYFIALFLLNCTPL